MKRGGSLPRTGAKRSKVKFNLGTTGKVRQSEKADEAQGQGVQIPIQPTAVKERNNLADSERPVLEASGNVGESHELQNAVFRQPRTGKKGQKTVRKGNKCPASVAVIESSSDSCFLSVLDKHGLSLSKEGNQFQDTEVRDFRKTLTDWICSCTAQDGEPNEELKKFLIDMKSYLKEKENLLNAISPRKHADEIYQSSLLHSLLGITPLQENLFAVVFPFLKESARNNQDVPFFKELLNQIKWLPDLDNALNLTDGLLRILEHAAPKAQQEMMILLPDIVPTQYHRNIGITLQKMLEDYSPVCPSILDCFSVLDVHPTDLVKVRETAVENMLVGDPKDLPSYIGFLLGVEDQVDLQSIIFDMREKLEFRPIVAVDEATRSSMKSLVDKIKFCASINDQLVTTWIKEVKDDFAMEPTQFKTLDLMMCLVFSASNKMALKPLRKLIANQSLTLQVFEEFLACLPSVVDVDYVFDGLLKFCEGFFWSGAKKYYQVASRILVKLFRVVSDRHAQEIIRLFTCTLAQGNQLCRDTIIEALAAIAEENIVRLLRFSNLIMKIMDFVLELSAQQIRSVVKIIAAVAYIINNSESQRFENQFSILLRKQLSQRNEKFKAIGIIGAVSAINQLAKQDGSASKLQELVELVWTIVQVDSNACWLFFDEMAAVVSGQNVPDKTLQYLRQHLRQEFRKNRTVEETALSNHRVGERGLKLLEVMNANETMDVESLFVKFESPTIGLHDCTLPALTKLLCVLESKLAGGDLKEVDIIIGCPLLLPEFQYYTSRDEMLSFSNDKKSSLACYLVFAINYLRELVSAFCEQPYVLPRIKVFLRLHQLVKLQQMLISFIDIIDCRDLNLPLAYALDNSFPSGNIRPVARKQSKGQQAKVLRAPLSDYSLATTDGPSSSALLIELSSLNVSETPGRNEGSCARGGDKDATDEIYPDFILSFFRRFHPHVFKLLKFRLHLNAPVVHHLSILEEVNNSEDSLRHRELLKQVAFLTPETMILILRDLNQQVENNFLSITQDVAAGFSKGFFSCLCDHLNVLFTSSEELLDSQKKQVGCCFRLIYSTIKSYLEKLSEIEGHEKFIEALTIAMKKMCLNGNLDEDIANFLGGNPNFIRNSAAAVEQLKALKIVLDCSENKKHICSKIREIANVYLKREWKLPALHISLILKVWLTTTEHPLKAILALAQQLVPEPVEIGVPDRSEYKSCYTKNFSTWYRVILEILCQHAIKNLKRKDLDANVAFQEWIIAVEILKLLVSVIEQHRQAKFILPFLKNSRLFLETFARYGLQSLPWKPGVKNVNQGRSLLKQLQTTTRKIQYICDHCKLGKHLTLISHVPKVKRVLELLVFRVRDVVTSHGAPNAFQLRILKHKNLDGEEIESQISDDDESDEDEELLGSEDDDHIENSENLFDMPTNEAYEVDN